jgi:ABC-type multidrug transport system fused ATPase/permease subunit
LSVGEKQLISFARALAFDPRVLILDEATSSIDTETEILIRDAVERMIAGRTSLVIAHRLSTIQSVDKIIVMHKGEIREVGTHQDLLAQRGLYGRSISSSSIRISRPLRLRASLTIETGLDAVTAINKPTGWKNLKQGVSY